MAERPRRRRWTRRASSALAVGLLAVVGGTVALTLSGWSTPHVDVPTSVQLPAVPESTGTIPPTTTATTTTTQPGDSTSTTSPSPPSTTTPSTTTTTTVPLPAPIVIVPRRTVRIEDTHGDELETSSGDAGSTSGESSDH